MDRSCLAVIPRMLVTYNQVPVPVVVPCVLSSITLALEAVGCGECSRVLVILCMARTM